MDVFRVQPLVQIIVELNVLLEQEFRLWLFNERISTYDLKTQTVGSCTMAYFKVDDAEKVVAWLKARGVEPRK